MRPANDDTSIAVQAEAIYLVNLLLMPGLGFLALLWLARRHAASANMLARCHLKQTVVASLWAGVLLAAVSVVIVLSGGFSMPASWIVAILYFLCCHAVLALFGLFGLARAMAGQSYVYPLVGSRKW